jgi:hypothetical protein
VDIVLLIMHKYINYVVVLSIINPIASRADNNEVSIDSTYVLVFPEIVTTACGVAPLKPIFGTVDVPFPSIAKPTTFAAAAELAE